MKRLGVDDVDVIMAVMGRAKSISLGIPRHRLYNHSSRSPDEYIYGYIYDCKDIEEVEEDEWKGNEPGRLDVDVNLFGERNYEIEAWLRKSAVTFFCYRLLIYYENNKSLSS